MAREKKDNGYLGPIDSSGTSAQEQGSNMGKVSVPPKKAIPDPLGYRGGK
jgi:hypothetical protein